MIPASLRSDWVAALPWSGWQQSLVYAMTRGLVESYGNIEEFRRKLGRQIQHCLRDNPYLKSLLEAQAPIPVFSEFKGPTFGMQASAISVGVEGLELLKAAASEELKAYIGQSGIIVGNKSFGEGSVRDRSIWESALNELVQLRFRDEKNK